MIKCKCPIVTAFFTPHLVRRFFLFNPYAQVLFHNNIRIINNIVMMKRGIATNTHGMMFGSILFCVENKNVQCSWFTQILYANNNHNELDSDEKKINKNKKKGKWCQTRGQ